MLKVFNKLHNLAFLSKKRIVIGSCSSSTCSLFVKQQLTNKSSFHHYYHSSLLSFTANNNNNTTNPTNNKNKDVKEEEEEYNKSKYDNKLTIIQTLSSIKTILFNGIFSFFKDFMKYKEMKREIRYRPFRVANRKEILFINSFRFNFIKILIPILFISINSKLILFYIFISYYFPFLLPTYFQTNKMKKNLLQNCHVNRCKEMNIIVNEILNTLQNNTLQNTLQNNIEINKQMEELNNLINLIKNKTINDEYYVLNNLKIILNKLLNCKELINYLIENNKIIFHHLCIYSFITRLEFKYGISGLLPNKNISILGSRIGGLESTKNNFINIINHLYMEIYIYFFKNYNQLPYLNKILNYYINLIKMDDNFIYHQTLSLKDMIDASYVRGFYPFLDHHFDKINDDKMNDDIYLKNKRENVQLHLNEWCEFTQQADDNVVLMATVLTFIK